MTTKNTAINTARNTARRGADPIRFRGLTLAWSGVDSRPIRRWRGLFAALLIVLGAAVAAPEQAAAQTETTFLSNTGQFANTASNLVRATEFTTGAITYTLSSVAIRLGARSEPPTPVVKIYGDASGNPGTLVATMTNPATIVDSTLNIFIDPASTTLNASTTYWLVTSNSASTFGTGWVVSTNNNNNTDSSTAAGWSIGNARIKTDINTASWTNSSSRHRFQIRGTVPTTTPTPTNNAPVFADTTLTRSIAENTAASVNVGAVIPAATDTDTGDTLTYSMEVSTDAASFNFNETTRQITTKTGVTYDFETKFSYSVTIKVSDETDTDTVAVTITLTDVNEPPSAPGAPTVAATSGSTTSLDVSWTAPGNDGKPAIASYDLQYRAGASGSFTDGPQDVTGTSTTIASLNAGTSYQVQVRATNDEGDSGWSSSGSGSTSATTPTNNVPIVAIPIPDQVAPVGAVFNFFLLSTTFSDADNDTLSYAATQADGTDLPTWLSVSGTGRSFTGTPAAADVGVVSVKVTASDGKGGSVSDVFDITVEVDTTPPTLTSATVNTSGGGINLVFSETVNGSTGVKPPSSAYTVTADGVALPVISGGNPAVLLLSFQTVRIRQGQTVVITYTDPTTGDDTLAIQDAAGNDAASFTTGMNSVPAVTNNSTLAPVAPNAPTGLTATASGTDTINLSWTAPVDNGGRVITGYKIEVSIDSGTTWTDLVADTASTTTTYEHTGLAASTTRHYRVSAINSIGTGTTPSDVVMTTTGTADNNAPVVAIPIPDQTATEGALFSYAFPDTTFTDADSGDTLSYTATQGDGTDLPTWLSLNSRTFSGTPAASDVGIVSVKVTVSDGKGGSVSDEFDITVEADTTPPTLTSVTVNSTGTTISFQFSERINSVNVPQASDSAVTVTAGGIDVPVDKVVRSPLLLDVVWVAVDPVFIRQGQDVVVTYTDPTTGDDAKAIQDTSGNDAASFTTGMNSVPAVINNSTRAAVAPNAPTGLTATASGTTTINLSWTAPVDNGGRVITGYKIEVSIDSGTTWTDLVADTASTTTYEHTGLAASTTRHYRVSAINSIGTGTTPSDVVDATTGAAAAVTPTGNLLVSNLGQSSDDNPTIELLAQAFTTGAHAAGYTLTSITLDCDCGSYTAGTVTLHSGTRTGTKVADFTGSPNAANDLVLTPTMATTLSASTTYVIVTADDFSNPATNWFSTDSGAEDSGSAAGWSISNDAEVYRTSTMMWATSPGPYKIRVGGNAIGEATNNPPTVTNAIPDQTATEGEAFSYQFPDTTFNDTDTGDTLSYTATKGDGSNLPTWLTFTPATRTFEGTPTASDVETVAVKVTATDTSSATVSDDFNIVVRAATVLHCNPSDPYEVFCATLTVGTGVIQGDTLFGYSSGGLTWGAITPLSFPWRTATVRVTSLQYSDGGNLILGILKASGTTPSDGLLGASNFVLEVGTGADKKTFAINNPGTTLGATFPNHGLSWSVDEMVRVKLLRLKPFSEKGPELVAPSRTEGWLQVIWGEPADATKVKAYNVEWRTGEDEAYRFQRVDKSAREHHLYNLKSGIVYEVRVCELSKILTVNPYFVRGACSRYSGIRMPSSNVDNDIKVSIEFPEGGAIKTLSTSDTVIRWRYRVTGIHNSGPEVFPSSAHVVAAGRVALQYRKETRRITVYGTATSGARAPLIQSLDDLGIRMDWLVFDRVGSGYVEREFRVDPSFRTTTDRGPLMLYLLNDEQYDDRLLSGQAVAARRDNGIVRGVRRRPRCRRSMQFEPGGNRPAGRGRHARRERGGDRRTVERRRDRRGDRHF